MYNLLFCYEIYFTRFKVNLPLAIVDTFPVVLFTHESPPVLKFCSCFPKVFYQFFIQGIIVNREDVC